MAKRSHTGIDHARSTKASMTPQKNAGIDRTWIDTSKKDENQYPVSLEYRNSSCREEKRLEHQEDIFRSSHRFHCWE